MATVSFQSLHKAFGDNDVIKGVDLEVGEGEFVVFVGPSGCGKSTLLRLLAGLERPDAGRLLIDGNDITNVAVKDRNIAMVFQNYALYPHMTVAENIGFGLKLRGMKKQERDAKVREAAQLLGLSDLLDRKPRQLSGGLRQRVAMGRAIVRQPSVFLMDEPLSNLDAELRGKMRADIKQLQQRLGVTTIYVTHDQVEAMTMADKIVILKDGEIVQVGTPQDLYDRPVNSFVAGFIGQPKMNFIKMSRDENGYLSDKNGATLNGKTVAMTQAKDQESCLFGIRPKDLSLVHAKNLPITWDAKVTLIEPLGGETLVHAAIGDTNLTIQTSEPVNLMPDDPVKLGLDPETTPFYTFHSETGLAL